MTLGHGCQPSTPTWIWLFFFSSAAICLPGGAWLKAQEGKESQEILNATAEKVQPAQSAIPMAPKAKDAWVESWQNERINVRDLLDKLETQHGNRETARRVLLSHIPQRSIQAANAEGNVTISQLPAFSIDDDELHLFETRDQIAVVKRAIEELRRCGFDKVRLRIKLVAVSAEQLDKLGLSWKAAVEPATDTTAKIAPIPFPTLEEILAVEGRLNAPAAPIPVQPASAVTQKSLQAPKVTKGASTTITLVEFESLVREGVKEQEKVGNPVDLDRRIADGMKVKQKNLAKSIATNCAVIDEEQASSFLKLSARTILGSPTVTCLSGSYAQMMSHAPWSTTPKIALFDRPAPIASKPQLGFSGFSIAALPVVDSGVDGNAERYIDLSLIVDVREVTRLETFTFAGEKAGGVESETDAMTVEQPVVEFKRLAVSRKLQPGESLLVSSRKPLAPESDGKVLVIMVTCDLESAGRGLNDNAQTVKATELHSQRVAIVGPITSGPDVKKIPEPPVDLVIQAWRKSKPKDEWLALQPEELRIKQTCIGDFADKRQFYPLIGEAMLHHAVYRCEAYHKDVADKSESGGKYLGSIVVDHQHFHLAED